MDETRELLGLVHRLRQLPGRLFEMNFPPEARRSHDVLDLDLCFVLDWDVAFLQPPYDLLHRLSRLLLRLGSRADHLPGTEDQRRGLRILEPEDEPRELVGMILDVDEVFRYQVEVDGLVYRGGGHDVLDADDGLRLRHIGEENFNRYLKGI